MQSLQSLLFLTFLCGAYAAQAIVRKELTLLEKFSDSLYIKKCDISWIKVDQATFLESCKILQPPTEDMTRVSSTAHLCITYLDLIAKVCSEVSKNASLKLGMPKSKDEINDIMNALSSPNITQNFCNVSHTDILNVTLNSSRSLPFILKTVEALSNPFQCQLTCLDYNYQLNPLCKSILYITKILNAHSESIKSMEMINQQKNVEAEKQSLSQLKSEKNQTIHNDAIDEKLSKPVISKEKGNSKEQPIPLENPHNTPLSVQQIPEIPEPQVISKPSPGDVKNVTPNVNVSLPKESPIQETSVIEQPIKKTDENNAKKVSLAPLPPVNIEEVEEDKPELDEADEDSKLDDLDPDDNPSLNDEQSDKLSKIDVNGFESASGVAGGVAPVEYPKNDHVNSDVKITGKYVNTEDSHFFTYFLLLSGFFIFLYVVIVNKHKVLGLLFEGRRGDTRRRCPTGGPAYKKLDCTLEEVVNSAPPPHTHTVY